MKDEYLGKTTAEASIEREHVQVCGDIRFTVAFCDLAYIEARWWPNRIDYLVREQGPKNEGEEHETVVFRNFNNAVAYMLAKQWHQDKTTDKFIEDPDPCPEEYKEADHA